MKAFDPNYKLLDEMYQDDYYPAFLVDKVKDELQKVIDLLESGETDTEVVQETLDEAVCGINDLQEEFDENDSEIETVARDCIGVTVAQIREAFGNQIEFGLDFHGRVSAPMAKVLIKELEPYRPLFIEEPVLAEQAEYYPKLAAQTHIPLAAGERMFSRFDFKRVLEAGGISILQPDLSHAGGITECYKIAGMAEAYDVTLAPHCPLGPIALAACLHIDFVSYNAVLQEQSMGIHYNKGAELLDFVKNKEDFSMVGGFFKPLTKPGLGVEIDEAKVIEFSKNAPDWRNPLWRHEDNSVAEW